MQRTAENPHHLHTTEWEDIQYQFGNRVGKYETHEEEILWRKAAQDPAAQSRDLAVYDPEKEKRRDFRLRNTEQSSDTSMEEREISSDDDKINSDVQVNGGLKEKDILVSDNTEEEDEYSILEKIRQKRLLQLKQDVLEMPLNAGSLRCIPGSAYVKEVTEDSARFWVVAMLIQPGESNCEALLSAMRTVAQRQRGVKFVSMVYTEVVGVTFPHQHLPCVLLYKHGKLQHQLTGPEHWKIHREVNCNQIEKTLRYYGVLSPALDEEQEECL